MSRIYLYRIAVACGEEYVIPIEEIDRCFFIQYVTRYEERVYTYLHITHFYPPEVNSMKVNLKGQLK